MPTRSQTAELAIRLFEDTLGERGVEKAWLGVYAVLLWHEDTKESGRLPHIIDADKLRPPRLRPAARTSPWVKRAAKVNTFLSEAFACQPDQVAVSVDSLMRSEAYQGVQRQNPLGIAFAELIAHVLRKFGDSRLLYRTEVPAKELFPGVTLQSRSRHPRIDIVAFRDSKPVAFVTSKWSIRHDRLTDVIDESISYRSAAMRLGLRPHCIFVTNEFDPARLDKVIGSDVLEFTVHVCPKLVTDVCGLNGRLAQLKDIPYLVSQTHLW